MKGDTRRSCEQVCDGPRSSLRDWARPQQRLLDLAGPKVPRAPLRWPLPQQHGSFMIRPMNRRSFPGMCVAVGEPTHTLAYAPRPASMYAGVCVLDYMPPSSRPWGHMYRALHARALPHGRWQGGAPACSYCRHPGREARAAGEEVHPRPRRCRWG